MAPARASCCRVCLTLNVAADAGAVCALRSARIRHQLHACLGISVSAADALPTVLCASCVARLAELDSFCALARRSQYLLQAAAPTPAVSPPPVPLPLLPLADCDYNSDSLLEFLNGTDNIEEYLRGLGDGALELSELASGERACLDIEMPESEKRTGDAENGTSYSCLACGSICDSFGTLSAHMSVCEPAMRTCFECGLRFDSKLKMLKHRMSHKASGTESICDACGKKFTNDDHLVRHFEECHNDFVASMGCIYRCKECGDRFKDRFKLYRHAKKHIVRSELLGCDACIECFASKEDLNDHKRTCHGNVLGGGSVLYRCKVCRIVCADRRQLYAHVKQHAAALDLQQHLCHACGKGYSSLAALKRHVVTHVGDKYKCRHCQKECIDSSALGKHMAMHERDSAMCEFCGVTFLKYDFLHKHLKDHT